MNYLQTQASNPLSSIWVSASAGTGKTKILTDRVLRLILQGADIDKILCLTFTKAAASEMSARILSKLSDWASFNNDEDLSVELTQTIGKAPSDDEIKIAKNLYWSYLKSNKSLNINTIHAFCQKILKIFPIESVVSPNFRVIGDLEQSEIIRHVKIELLRSPRHKSVSKYLASNFHDIVVQDIFHEIISQKIKFMPCATTEWQYQDILSRIELSDSNEHFMSLKGHKLIQKILSDDISTEDIKNLFFTQKGEKRKTIGSKLNGEEAKELSRIQENLYILEAAKKENFIINYSMFIFCLGNDFVHLYNEYKIKNSLLDYDDLIIKTMNLFQKSSTKEWVLYKLDGGIEHLLVDEAQDTSDHQWQIIDALISEFYAGETNNHSNRTLFVVGDEKQSIFSFQGANVDAFYFFNQKFRQNFKDAYLTFNDISLDISYRSAPEIIEVVEHVFKEIKNIRPEFFNINFPKLKSHRSKAKGVVEVWITEDSKPENKQEFWPIQSQSKLKKHRKLLADQISKFIQQELSANELLNLNAKKISLHDFMILFRKRDDFMLDVIESLRNNDLGVTGIDKITLADNIIIQDLLSVAKFMLNQEDDLNLASLLKSPIIGMREEDLYIICAHRGKKSLWSRMQDLDQYAEILVKLKHFLSIFKDLNNSNIFHYLCDVLNYRKIFNNLYSSSSDEIIDEFLYFCHNYYEKNGTSLQQLITSFESYEVCIKRDLETADKIRIMTAHASKGLQAKYVIICDPGNLKDVSEKLVWDKDNNLFITKNSSSLPEFFVALKDERKLKKLQEYIRLLYVAMTRAEDKLVICNYNEKEEPDACSWYNFVKSSIEKIGVLVECKQGQDEIGLKKLIYGHLADPGTPSLDIKLVDDGVNDDSAELNSGALREILQFTSRVQEHRIDISKEKKDSNALNEPEFKKLFPVHSPLRSKNPVEYGVIFHKIIHDALCSGNLNNMFTHPLINNLSEKHRLQMLESMNLIINNDLFLGLIRYPFKTELSIGLQNVETKYAKIGRIDLVILENECKIHLVDYKSDFIKFKKNQLVIPKEYQLQMAFYKNAISKIYPHAEILCKILWLQNGKIVDLHI